MKKIILSIFAMSLLIVSCSEDNDDNISTEPLGAYEDGIIVSGEGDPSSISFISEDLMTSENQIYFNVNNEATGVYLQSLGFNDDDAYIVADAGTITAVNRYTFEKSATISTRLTTPRYIAFEDNTAYVSDWGDPNDATDDYIAVIDLTSNTVISTIPVSEGPEQILEESDKLYVSHKGGYGINNLISVINIADNTVETIAVNYVPDEMAINDEGDLVVLCEGGASWSVVGETSAALVKIDLSDNSIISNLEFSAGEHPSLMAYEDGTTYYILNNEVFSLTDNATSLPTSSLFSITAAYAYGLSVNDNQLFVTDASFTENSTLLVYDLVSGAETNTFSVGVAASKIYFN
ncbi:YncE family protein [Winogradskyella wichelsiae]|uniref:YncE family protein n=1 Tax=Winogradskyella wichelsiae TaxID=2697007 RepID=UPI003EF7EDBA